MFRIIKKRQLNPYVELMELEAPPVAAKAEPGQFVIIRSDEKAERIPLTIADFDRKLGTIKVIFQTVGDATYRLGLMEENDCICDLVGPLGKASELEELKKVCIVGGGVGCAIAYPIAKKLFRMGAEVHTIAGFRSKDLVILEDEFELISHRHIKTSDDGTYGMKGLVTDRLRELLDAGEKYDMVFAIGPLIMMKFVCAVTKEYGVKTTVSMNPIMIDGTGMCGGCRLTVGGETKFACVDGPDFDGHLVDFDESMARGAMYRDFERHAYESTCNLFKKEVK